MPMGLLTVFQLLATLGAYLFLTMVIPCAVFGKHIGHYRYTKRLLIYFMTGNFYVSNLVFALELLHISNFFTLWFGLVGIPVIIWGIINKYPVKQRFDNLRFTVKKLFAGSMGLKSAFFRIWDRLKKRVCDALKRAAAHYFRHWLEWLLVAVLTAMVMWVYGTRAFRYFGYAASDIPVHLYWVTGLSDNDIFVAGIYPFGMHAIIYAINTALGIDTYVIFRVFALVQCLAIHIMALQFLKLCCKSKYAPYVGVFIYTIGSYISTNDLSRYNSTLPQEYSMVYIMPTLYFAISFYKQKRRELKENLSKKESKDSLISLACLAMSFANAFTAHFYGAIIAGICCVGIGVGHILWTLRPKYLGRIAAAGTLSVVVAVLPMVIAFAMGKPLQGSLYWAQNIIKGTSDETSQTASPDTDGSGGETDGSGVTVDGSGEIIGGDDGSLVEEPVAAPKVSLTERVKNLANTAWSSIRYRINHYVLANSRPWYCSLILGMIGFLIAAGVFYMLFKPTRSYGAMLASMGFAMVFMSVLFIANSIGLPPLIGADRVCIFYAYMLISVIGLTVDVCAYTVSLILRHTAPMQLISLAAAVASVIVIWQDGRIRQPFSTRGLEMNEAVTCLTNIISSEKDYKWTIFSANDETHMVYGHGYHYELSVFLHEIEKLKDKPVTVPTEAVYFFVEKIPLDYTVSYDGSGQMISRKGAEYRLPNEEGLGNYQARNRWIIMSRMYYWAEEFMRLYPNEMKVYFENDYFICYRLEQNTYRQFDLAIDYGYNNA